ncbi:hypothetical protein KAR34_08160 [bacterium]|nr:hypothetical protein [bacterium]
MLDVGTIHQGNITLQARDETITLTGSIDMVSADEFLRSFFDTTTHNILKHKLKAVKVDVKNLTYINSSGIKELAAWILRLKELADEQKFKIIFQCDLSLEWQERTFKVMVWLNECVSIET